MTTMVDYEPGVFMMSDLPSDHSRAQFQLDSIDVTNHQDGLFANPLPLGELSGLGSDDESQDQDSPTSQNPNLKTGLYKTELCKRFQEFGSCRYGTKCQFAHGEHELRQLRRHPKYKTVKCRSYWSTGHCPYGQRCRFLHDEPSTSPVHFLQQPSPTKMSGLHRIRTNSLPAHLTGGGSGSLSPLGAPVPNTSHTLFGSRSLFVDDSQAKPTPMTEVPQLQPMDVKVPRRPREMSSDSYFVGLGIPFGPVAPSQDLHELSSLYAGWSSSPSKSPTFASSDDIPVDTTVESARPFFQRTSPLGSPLGVSISNAPLGFGSNPTHRSRELRARAKSANFIGSLGGDEETWGSFDGSQSWKQTSVKDVIPEDFAVSGRNASPPLPRGFAGTFGGQRDDSTKLRHRTFHMRSWSASGAMDLNNLVAALDEHENSPDEKQAIDAGLSVAEAVLAEDA